MAFKAKGRLGETHGGPVLAARILTNSVAVVEMDSIKMASGFAALGTAGVLVFGHVTGIRTEEGIGLETSGVVGAATGSFLGAYTAASDNQTVAKVKVTCDISKNTVYSAEVDATIGTTTGSNLAGYFMDLIDEDTLDEDSAAATAAQYATHGVDADLTSQAMVNIYESVVLG